MHGQRAFLITDLSVSNRTPAIKTRSEVAPGDCWDLSPIFASEEGWEQEFSSLNSLYPGVAIYRGKLATGAESLLALLEFEKSLDQSTEKLGQYAALRLSEDSSDAVSLDRDGRLQSLCAKISEACSWVAPEIQDIPDVTFESFLQDPLRDSESRYPR